MRLFISRLNLCVYCAFSKWTVDSGQCTDRQWTCWQMNSEQATANRTTAIGKTANRFKTFCIYWLLWSICSAVINVFFLFFPAFGFCLNQMCFLTTIIVEVNYPCKIFYIISTWIFLLLGLLHIYCDAHDVKIFLRYYFYTLIFIMFGNLILSDLS